jgi:citrate synthase
MEPRKKDKDTIEIKRLVKEAWEKAKQHTANIPEPELTRPIKWPVQCLVGPGLEGAIAAESKIGYVNGSKGWLIYRGYDIFDLCINSSFEEVSYLLLHGHLPTAEQLGAFNQRLVRYRDINETKRFLLSFPVERMNAMAALRIGATYMRQEFTYVDREQYVPSNAKIIGSDEDSIPMETKPMGERHAIYEFRGRKKRTRKIQGIDSALQSASGIESCYHLISGVASVAAAISRIKQGKMPVEPDPALGHAGNFLYMMTGKKPTPLEEKIMDISLILHADHGMNASTFAAMVVASTLSDIYLSVGSGIAALSGPLHGGANEHVLYMLDEIGGPGKVRTWLRKKVAKKEKIMGFGHRVYKAYDPRARVLGPLAEYMAHKNSDGRELFRTAKALEKEVVSSLGRKKGVFPNVDFYSGIVYACLGIPPEMFTPIFAVSRVAGWTARVLEYLQNNRIFRPRAMYTGQFDKKYVPIKKRK